MTLIVRAVCCSQEEYDKSLPLSEWDIKADRVGGLAWSTTKTGLNYGS